MTRTSTARLLVILVAALGALAACKEKPKPAPTMNPYQVGSIVVNLPASVKIPMPQGRPDEPGVNQTKCNYAVDRKITLMSQMTKDHPEYKDQLTQARPSIMAECLQKWTQQEYDCIVAAKVAEDAVMCNRFRKPLAKPPATRLFRGESVMRISVAAVAVASVVSLVSFASVAAAQGAPPAAGAPAPPPPGYNAPPGGGPPPGYPPPGYPPPGYAYPPPAYAYPPAAPPDASVHNHDGFYLQMALGFAYVSDSNTPPTGGDVKLTGGGGTGQLMIGGTVGRGVVLGGGLQASVFSNPKVKLADGSTATGNGASLNVTAVGPFVDYYFDPHEGLHLQALVGLGTLSVTNGNGTSDSSINPKGLALSVGFGDEWWVAEQWSIGILARLQYVSAKASNDVPTGLGTSVTYEDKHSVVIPALLATFTLH